MTEKPNVTLEELKTTVNIDVQVRLSFWQACKLRLAGLKGIIQHEQQQRRQTQRPQVTPYQLAVFMHNAYEEEAVLIGWQTQASCNGRPFMELPEKNKTVMLNVAQRVLFMLDLRNGSNK